MNYDLIISGGTIVDGTGGVPYKGDLAIRDGKIAKISCPSLVLHGAEDGVAPIGIGEVAAALLQNSEMVVMGGCGHVPFLEDIEAYNRHVISFLGRCSQ